MEKEKPGVEIFRKEIKQALKNWQTDPENSEMSAKMSSMLRSACDAKLNLIFGVHDSIFDDTEARRGINREEIQKYARKSGNFWVFYLTPMRGSNSKMGVSVLDLLNGEKDRGVRDKFNFVMRVGEGKARHELLILRPNEIAGITVR